MRWHKRIVTERAVRRDGRAAVLLATFFVAAAVVAFHQAVGPQGLRLAGPVAQETPAR